MEQIAVQIFHLHTVHVEGLIGAAIGQEGAHPGVGLVQHVGKGGFAAVNQQRKIDIGLLAEAVFHIGPIFVPAQGGQGTNPGFRGKPGQIQGAIAGRAPQGPGDLLHVYQPVAGGKGFQGFDNIHVGISGGHDGLWHGMRLPRLFSIIYIIST